MRDIQYCQPQRTRVEHLRGQNGARPVRATSGSFGSSSRKFSSPNRSSLTPQWLPSLALPIQSDLSTDRYWAGRPRSDNWQRLKAIDPPRESVGSVCACEQVTGTSARYACSEDHDHECKPSPHRHTSASTSGEKAGQAARADCGSTGNRTGCARSKGAANLFTIPLDDERETASSGGLAGSAQ